MTKKNPKEKQISPLRNPKPKNRLGLKVPSIQLPHLELVAPTKNEEALPRQTRQTRASSQTRQTTQPRQSNQTEQSFKEKSASVAPVRDYQKVPNSVTKKAIPEGLFKPGKSKHLYDVLYSLTRGAIEPVRSVRISKTKLMRQAGIGSRITFDSIIGYFERVGLLRVTVRPGEHEGNEFEVFTYEEIETVPAVPSQTRQASLTSPAQKLDTLVRPESSQTRHSLNDENTRISPILKTSLKTLNLTDDDAPLVVSALERLNEAARAATGKNLTRKDWEAFGEIIELITSETAVARTRTRSVSIYLKFAAENLRRRLYSKQSKPVQSEQEKPNWVEVGKEFQTYEYDEQGNVIPKPLSREQREQALQNLIEFRTWNAPIEDSERFYTPEDWAWLIRELNKEN